MMACVVDLDGPPEHVWARAVHGAVPHRAGPGQPGPGTQGGRGEEMNTEQWFSNYFY